MKFAFYDSLTEAAQILVKGVFCGKINSVYDSSPTPLTVKRSGRTVTLNDRREVIVVVSIPQWIRDGFDSEAAWKEKHG